MEQRKKGEYMEERDDPRIKLEFKAKSQLKLRG